jgi:chloramphenicol O-acetyltransferase type A
MPISIHVHHGLMDGSHLGQFVDYFQEIMNQKNTAENTLY